MKYVFLLIVAMFIIGFAIITGYVIAFAYNNIIVGSPLLILTIPLGIILLCGLIFFFYVFIIIPIAESNLKSGFIREQ